ncbi:hypothetical protein [Paraburkholderia sp. BL9I2N2]|uniref:hypothetical protein n=1 Tax=Paraburkholderia sp. BL9I2N2 TaxID=1938809 RepID=UPI0010472900|nr:hypothetical protein [Paraburkholderia sp. BL9I2N2]TCK96230.1 hypothetical protein B0G74_2889 [Paraburkholderia sp. BL9I2N2]
MSADKIYTMVVSTLALFLSGSLAIYTLFKDRKARTQSISDDYWLRKVVSPLAIEPLIKTMLETISAIPPDCCGPNFLPDALDAFMSKYQQDHRIQSTNLIAFGLLSPKLYDPASEAFDEVEDAVITYCNSNRNGLKTASGEPVEPKDKLAERIRTHLNSILQLVREYQSSLK